MPVCPVARVSRGRRFSCACIFLSLFLLVMAALPAFADSSATAILVKSDSGGPFSGNPGQYVWLKGNLRRLTDNAGLPGRTLLFRVGGQEAGSAVTIGSGSAWCRYLVPLTALPGAQEVTAEFAGDEDYAASSGANALSIGKINARVLVRSDSGGQFSGQPGQGVWLKGSLIRAADSAGLEGRALRFAVDGQEVGTAKTIASGSAWLRYVLPVGMTPGAHSLSVTFAGDEAHNGAAGTGTLTVLPGSVLLRVISDAGTAFQGQAGQYVWLKANLRRASDGTALPDRILAFSVDGQPVGTAITTGSGSAWLRVQIPASAPVGVLKVTVAYAGDEQVLPTVGEGTLYVLSAAPLSPESVVAFRCMAPNRGLYASIFKIASYSARLPFAASVSRFRLAYGNFYTQSGFPNVERDGPNPVDYRVSVEFPIGSGVLYPVTFGGQRTGTAQPGQRLTSDPIELAVLGGQAARVITCVDVSQYGPEATWPVGLWGSAGTEVLADGSGEAEGYLGGVDLTDTPQLLTNGGPLAAPSLVTGEPLTAPPPTVLLSGDSIVNGSGANRYRNFGYAEQALQAAGIPYILIARGGETIGQAAQPDGIWRRLQLADTATHAIVGYGTNDLSAGASVEAIKANLVAYWTALAAQGKKVIVATLVPRAGSSDFFSTTAGQSLLSHEEKRVAINEWIRSYPCPIYKVADVADAVEADANNVPRRNGGRWRVGAVVETGTATGATPTTLTDATQTWPPGAWITHVVRIVEGTGAGQARYVTVSGATQLTVHAAWSALPDATSRYEIVQVSTTDGIHPSDWGHGLMATVIDLAAFR